MHAVPHNKEVNKAGTTKTTKELSREDILNVDDIGDNEKIEVPEWGGHIFIRTITGKERDEWEYQRYVLNKGSEGVNARASLVSLAVVNSNGKRLFAPEDVEALGNKSSVALDRVVNAVRLKNRLGTEMLEDLEKN